MRLAMYAAVSDSENGVISQRSATRCFSWRRLMSSRRVASSGCPASTSGNSFSVVVSMFASSRISSSSSVLRLCASSTTSALLSPLARRACSTRSSSPSMAAFDRDASALRPKLRARISTNSDRVSAGLFRYTQRTCLHCSDSRAVFSSVVFPVPASPINSVTALAEDRPYCRLLSASWCRGVM